MLEGIFGAYLSHQVNNSNNAGNRDSNSAVSGVDFRNTMLAIARSANMTIADKGLKQEITNNHWRDLEDNLYFNPEEEKEDAAVEYLKKLKKLLKEKLGS